MQVEYCNKYKYYKFFYQLYNGYYNIIASNYIRLFGRRSPSVNIQFGVKPYFVNRDVFKYSFLAKKNIQEWNSLDFDLFVGIDNSEQFEIVFFYLYAEMCKYSLVVMTSSVV